MVRRQSIVIVIVLVNSRFLKRPQKRSRGNQLIHRRITGTKSKGSELDTKSQADRQPAGYGGMGKTMIQDRIYKKADRTIGNIVQRVADFKGLNRNHIIVKLDYSHAEKMIFHFPRGFRY